MYCYFFVASIFLGDLNHAVIENELLCPLKTLSVLDFIRKFFFVNVLYGLPIFLE